MLKLLFFPSGNIHFGVEISQQRQPGRFNINVWVMFINLLCPSQSKWNWIEFIHLFIYFFFFFFCQCVTGRFKWSSECSSGFLNNPGVNLIEADLKNGHLRKNTVRGNQVWPTRQSCEIDSAAKHVDGSHSSKRRISKRRINWKRLYYFDVI